MIEPLQRDPSACGWHCHCVDGDRYRLVVEGELGPRYSTVFEGMHMELHHGKTVVVGTIKDQAHLHGLLDRVASLGLKLVSVTREDCQERRTRGGPRA